MRSSNTLALICVCTALACTPTDPDASSSESIVIEPVPDPDMPPVGAWVVIDEARGLFETADAHPVRIATQHRDQPTERLRIAEVTAIVGDFIEVRTIAGPPEAGCASNSGFERDHELRFFVQFGALQWVLTRPKQFEFDYGAKLELAAGVPVTETGAEGRIRIGKTQLVVDLANEEVGLWFAAPTIEPASRPPAELWNSNLELHYGDRSFVAEWDPFLGAHERIVAGDRQLLTFVNACGRFMLWAERDRAGLYTMQGPQAVPRSRVDPDMPAPDGILGQQYEPGGCTPLRWTAPIGAELSWSSGGEAGVVRTRHELPSSAEQRDDRVCFEVSALDVCIAAATLERRGDADCKPVESPTCRRKPISQVRQAKAQVSTGLDRDIVRRIVRSHIAELRKCYDAGLDRHPTLAGRIEVAFEIDIRGKVSSSSVKTTTLEPADEKVPACFAKAFERWTFPEPSSDSTVSVVYPFELRPS